MIAFPAARHIVSATVEEVLPLLGLAYVLDDEDRSWAVTRSMNDTGVGDLHPGQRLQLRIAHHGDFSLVAEFDRLA